MRWGYSLSILSEGKLLYHENLVKNNNAGTCHEKQSNLQ